MSFLRNKCILLTSLIAASSVAQAQPEEGFTIAPSIGYYNMDNHRSVDNSTAFSLGLGYQFGNPWAIELVYVNADSETTSGSDIDVDQYRLDGLYHLEGSDLLTPYLAAGVGTTDFSSGPNNALINVGGGLKYALNDSLALRADVRLINDTEDHEFDNLTTVGLHYVFGVKDKVQDTDNDGVIDTNDQCLSTPSGVSVDAKGCALDDDKDGVANHIDQCLNTPSGVSVDVKGCALDDDKDGVANHIDQCLNTPSGVSVDANGCALDNDKDGVINSLDICPNSAAGAKVDTKGCALDDDKDGVINSLDMCPNSAAGAKVDAKGCYVVLEEAKTISLDVQFANNSVLIDPKYYAQIEEVADFLTEYPEADAVIEGHTDDRGTESYNQALSEKRAQAITDVLINSFSISQDRISAIGYGEEKPLVSNNSAENRRVNRRVTAVISN